MRKKQQDYKTLLAQTQACLYKQGSGKISLSILGRMLMQNTCELEEHPWKNSMIMRKRGQPDLPWIHCQSQSGLSLGIADWKPDTPLLWAKLGGIVQFFAWKTTPSTWSRKNSSLLSQSDSDAQASGTQLVWKVLTAALCLAGGSKKARSWHAWNEKTHEDTSTFPQAVIRFLAAAHIYKWEGNPSSYIYIMRLQEDNACSHESNPNWNTLQFQKFCEQN